MAQAQTVATSYHSSSINHLRWAWEQAYGVPPAAGLGRDLLSRGISWKEQERIEAAFSPLLARELARLAMRLDRPDALEVEQQISLKIGTCLVRQWQGRTCRVTVLSEGFQYDGNRYASLSQIARVVTGTIWSGPRFFGLRQPAGLGLDASNE